MKHTKQSVRQDRADICSQYGCDKRRGEKHVLERKMQQEVLEG